ncbi:hypothetical protein E4U27_000782, partial [Claviceps purpurea]
LRRGGGCIQASGGGTESSRTSTMVRAHQSSVCPKRPGGLTHSQIWDLFEEAEVYTLSSGNRN